MLREILIGALGAFFGGLALHWTLRGDQGNSNAIDRETVEMPDVGKKPGEEPSFRDYFLAILVFIPISLLVHLMANWLVPELEGLGSAIILGSVVLGAYAVSAILSLFKA